MQIHNLIYISKQFTTQLTYIDRPKKLYLYKAGQILLRIARLTYSGKTMRPPKQTAKLTMK